VERPKNRLFNSLKVPEKVLKNQPYSENRYKERYLKEDQKIPESVPVIESEKEKEVKH